MKAKIPTKIEQEVKVWKDNKPFILGGLTEEQQKINEIIDYLYELTPYNDKD